MEGLTVNALKIGAFFQKRCFCFVFELLTKLSSRFWLLFVKTPVWGEVMRFLEAKNQSGILKALFRALFDVGAAFSSTVR